MASTAQSRGLPGLFAALFFITLSILALKEMRLSTTASAVSAPMEAAVNSLAFPDTKYSLREKYTGIEPLDLGLRYLVAAFLPGVAGWDKEFQIQQIYFLVSFFPIIAIQSAEAGRKRSGGSWTSFTSIWALLYQTVGGAIIIPLYYLAYMWESAHKDYWSPASRHISTSYAKALLPSLLIGYLFPTILMYLPFPDPDLRINQALVALWQFSPLLVNLLLRLSSTSFGKDTALSTKNPSPVTDDLKYLDRLYITCFIVSAIAHISTILACLYSTPEISLTTTLLRVPTANRLSLSGGLHYIFQVDFLIIFLAALAGSFLTLCDLKRTGHSDLSLTKSAVAMLAGVVCVGPAAVVSGVWYVRDHIMAQKQKR